MTKPVFVDTYKEVASKLGRTEECVKRWKREGAPIGEPPYDVIAIGNWRTSAERKKRGSLPEITTDNDRPLTTGEKLKLAELEYKTVCTSLKKLNEAEILGKLIPIEDAIKANNTLASEVNKYLRAIPKKYASQLQNIEKRTEVEDILNEIVMEVLAVLSSKRKEK